MKIQCRLLIITLKLRRLIKEMSKQQISILDIVATCSQCNKEISDYDFYLDVIICHNCITIKCMQNKELN